MCDYLFVAWHSTLNLNYRFIILHCLRNEFDFFPCHSIIIGRQLSQACLYETYFFFNHLTYSILCHDGTVHELII